MSGDSGGPAFPLHPDFAPRYGFRMADSDSGMTLRDYFAAKALPCVPGFQDESKPGTWAEQMAAECYELADAMLKERAK